MAHYQFLDELVKEYILFRGFTSTLKAFDGDLKNENEKSFRVDRILEQINCYISTHDLTGLLELWKHFDVRLFSKLETRRIVAVKKLENSLLKLYVVNCIQTKQQDKLREFFERLSPDLQGQSEWKDWFALPFLTSVQDNPVFTIYFSRQWQDTLMLSLHNFLSLVFQSLPPPRLAEFRRTSARIKSMREEIKNLKVRLASEDPLIVSGNFKNLEPPPPREIMDDFYLIAQEAAATDNQVKSIKSFLRNITGGGGSSNTSGSSYVEKKKPLQASVITGERKPLQASVRTGVRERSKSRSASASRKQPLGVVNVLPSPSTQVIVSKQPLKRVTQSVNPLDSRSKITGVVHTQENSQSILADVVQTQEDSRSILTDLVQTKEDSQAKPTGVVQTQENSRSKPTVVVQTQENSQSKILPTLAVAVMPPPTNQDVDHETVTRYILLGQEEYREHRSPVTGVTVSPCGRHVVTSDRSGVVKVWSPTPDPTTKATFISASPVTATAWVSGSDRFFLYGTAQGQVRLCDMTEKTCSVEVAQELLNGGQVEFLRSSPSGLSFICCVESRTLVIETRTCRLESDLTSPLSSITSAVYNHNGNVLVHGGQDGKIGLTDLNRGELLSSWSGHTAPVVQVTLPPDETTVWSLAVDGSLTQSSMLQTGNKLWEGVVGGFALLDDLPRFCLSPTGDHILINSPPGGVIYKLPGKDEGELEKVLGLRDEQPVTAVEWSSGDCGPVFTGGSDGCVTISTLLCQS